MFSVMILCPNARRKIYTGIDTDEASFDGLPDVAARTRCPICGEQHVWTKSKAWLADADLHQQPRAA
jgi:hypothetical protein